MAIDLSRWNLTIPVGAQTISTADLNAGYASAFFVRNADGSITFIAPSSGDGIQSTTNSTYPRSELRETLTDGSVKAANWIASSQPIHILEATMKIDELPASKKAIIGQFHGDSNNPPLKIQITDTTIYAQLRRQLNGTEDKPVLMSNYVLGTYITYKVELYAAGYVKFYINGTQVVNSTLPQAGYQFDMTSYASDTWYAKAGVYSQEVVGGVGQGVTTFSALRMYHGAIPARTLNDITNDVNTTLAAFQAHTMIGNDALNAITALKTEADTFPSGSARTAVYTVINNARDTIGNSPAWSGSGRTLANLSSDITTIVSNWQHHLITATVALNQISVIKTEADTDFQKGTTRSNLYVQITDARTLIQNTPVRTLVDVTNDVNSIQTSFQPGITDITATNASLSALKTEADTFPDNTDRAAVYALIAQVTILVNRTIPVIRADLSKVSVAFQDGVATRDQTLASVASLKAELDKFPDDLTRVQAYDQVTDILAIVNAAVPRASELILQDVTNVVLAYNAGTYASADATALLDALATEVAQLSAFINNSIVAARTAITY